MELLDTEFSGLPTCLDDCPQGRVYPSLPSSLNSGLVHFNRRLPRLVWMERHQLKEFAVMSACLCARELAQPWPVFLSSALSLGNSILQVPGRKTMQACMKWLSRGHTV